MITLELFWNSNEGRAAVATDDQFVVQDESLNIGEDFVKEGKPSIQNLLTVVQKTNIQEALPQAITLLELAAVTPLRSVHCERVFSRMNKMVSPARSTMLQNRKEMLVFLQVEHGTLGWLSQQPNFKPASFPPSSRTISIVSKDLRKSNLNS